MPQNQLDMSTFQPIDQPKAPPPTPAGSNLDMSTFQPLSSGRLSPPTSSPTSSLDMSTFQSLGGASASPETGQASPEPTSMLGKAWKGANTPLIGLNGPGLLYSAKSTDSGFMGGLEDVLSGLTSPLSIGLTVATLGGGTILRGLGLAAEEMPVALRGAQALLKAGQAADGSAEALTALRTAGFAESEIPTAMKGANALFKAGVDANYIPHMNSLVKSAPHLMDALEKVGIKQEAFPTVVRGIKSLIDAGFTAQAAFGVIRETPEVLDAMKEGRYDDAARLATHVAAGGAMGVLGFNEFGKDFGKTWEDLQIAAGGKVKLSETNRLLRISEGQKANQIQIGKDEAKTYADTVRKTYDKIDDLHASATGDLMRAGIDDPTALSTLTDRHDSLAEAYGKSEQKIGKQLPEVVQALRRQGLIYRSNFPEGYYDFQDPTTGGSINIKEGDSIENAQAKIAAHRESINVNDLSDVAKTKQLDAQERSKEQLRKFELIDKQAAKGNLSEADKQFVLDSYKEAIKAIQDPNNPVSGQMFEMARQHRAALDKLLRVAGTHGLIKEGIKNYLTNIWEKEDLDTPSNNVLMNDAKSDYFMKDLSMARHRVFENAFDGQLLGRKLKTNDPTTLTSHYMDAMSRVIANKQFLNRVFDLKASDGRPLAALSGSGHWLRDKITGKPVEPGTLFNDPDAIRNIKVSDKDVADLKANGKFDRFLANDVLVKIPTKEGQGDHYAWNTHDYLDIDSNAMTDWAYGGTTPDGTTSLIKSRYMVHPEGKDYLTRLLGADPGVFKQSKPFNWLLKISSEAKHMMLSFSPFHIAQEGLRALATGINPIIQEHMDIHDYPTLQTGVEEGLTRPDRSGLSSYQEGLQEGLGGRSKVIDAIGKAGDKLGLVGKPLSVMRDIQNGMTKFLFDRYIPNLKDRAFIKLHERWTAKLQDDTFFNKLQNEHPEFEGYTKDRAAARLAAEETNERFGGINYKMIGRAAGTQDFLRLATLAPDWLESEVRSLARTLDPTTGVMARRDFVRLTASLWGATRILNMLVSGKMHNEAPFGVAWTDQDGKEKVYSVRTLPTDMFHMISDPVNFMRGRASPFVRAGTELYEGRDFQGRKLTPVDTAVDIVRNNLFPIGAQALYKGATGGNPDLTTVDQAVKAGGLTATVYKTEAQKLAYELASNKNETGPVDERDLAKHRAVIDLENRVRSGHASVQDLNTLVEQGHISQKDAKTVQKNVQETQGLDPEMAGLYTRASRLPMPDFIKIWDAATPNEQAVLSKLLLKKRTSYNNRVMKELTPEQRAKDPTYNRLKQIFPGQPIF